MKRNQSGFAQIIVAVLVIVGLIGGLYLVQHQTIFKPHAQEITISPPTPLPQPSTGLTCNSQLTDFSVSDSCSGTLNGFRSVHFACNGAEYDDSAVSINPNACRSLTDWVIHATSVCQNLCPHSPTPSPVASEPRVCAQVLTAAVSPIGQCQVFPTPCEVPDSWTRIGGSECPVPTPAPSLNPVGTPSASSCRINMSASAVMSDGSIQITGNNGTLVVDHAPVDITLNWQSANDTDGKLYADGGNWGPGNVDTSSNNYTVSPQGPGQYQYNLTCLGADQNRSTSYIKVVVQSQDTATTSCQLSVFGFCLPSF